MEEYANLEDLLMIESVIQKSDIRISHPVFLTVQPLTIADALAMDLQLPSVEGKVDIGDNTSEIRRRIPIRARCKCELYYTLSHYFAIHKDGADVIHV